jgi:hypothetical protein
VVALEENISSTEGSPLCFKEVCMDFIVYIADIEFLAKL